jgi:hypothetical protein
VYRIAVDGKNGAQGWLDLRYTASLPPPANDRFAAAQTLPGPAGTVVASTIGATAEAGEPDSDIAPTPKSVWFRWTAPRSGLYSFDTNGTAAPFRFNLYTGSTVSSLTPVGVRADLRGTTGPWPYSNAQQIYLLATAGVTYALRVDNPYDPGEWVVNWSDGAGTASEAAP